MARAFLSLPGEIRNEIYGHLLVSDEPITPSSISLVPVKPIKLSPNILSTNSTILREARFFLYGKNQFDLSRSLGVTECVIEFLDTIGSLNASYIRSMQIPFSALSYDREEYAILGETTIDFLENIVWYCTGLETLTIAERKMDHWQRSFPEGFLKSTDLYESGIGIINSYFQRMPSLRKITAQVYDIPGTSELRREIERHGWMLKVVAREPESESDYFYDPDGTDDEAD